MLKNASIATHVSKATNVIRYMVPGFSHQGESEKSGMFLLAINLSLSIL
ncbi:MAG: hypothetical protein SRB1_02704 [Desulfobacteraceae bacterium Eth-SRB1]|nr:MAG: hypothetical protein SRB1_02704 [Desulfobacteraceae bacterium Eth-SRB1]